MNTTFQWMIVILVALLYLLIHFYFNNLGTNNPSCVKVYDAPYGSFECRHFRPDFTIDNTGTLPFVSGSNFVLYSDHVYDNHVKNVFASQLKDGDMIYVKTDFIGEFFERIFPRIKTKFILVTHNSDYSTNPDHIKYLEDDKVIVWFGNNPGFEHPKLIPTPTGLENTFWYPEKIKHVRESLNSQSTPWNERKHLLYLNFNPGTNAQARSHLFDSFRNKSGVLINQQKLDYATYLARLGDSKFVLCPRGNGLDTHRFYETLLMGAIPVVENSTLYPIFMESTTLVVPDLNKLDIEMLRNPKPHIKDWSFTNKVLLWDTWSSKIEQIRSEYRQSYIE